MLLNLIYSGRLLTHDFPNADTEKKKKFAMDMGIGGNRAGHHLLFRQDGHALQDSDSSRGRAAERITEHDSDEWQS